MISGGGCGNDGPCSAVSLNGVRREAWNTGWMVHHLGSSSSYTRSESLVLMVKGPSRLGESFAERLGVFRFVASSHTFCPGWKGVNLVVVCLIIRFRASSRAAAASFR